MRLPTGVGAIAAGAAEDFNREINENMESGRRTLVVGLVGLEPLIDSAF
jgi:hypothetical protein